MLPKGNIEGCKQVGLAAWAKDLATHKHLKYAPHPKDKEVLLVGDADDSMGVQYGIFHQHP